MLGTCRNPDNNPNIRHICQHFLNISYLNFYILKQLWIYSCHSWEKVFLFLLRKTCAEKKTGINVWVLKICVCFSSSYQIILFTVAAQAHFLSYLHFATSTPTMFQFMTQTNLTLIGLPEIQSNKEFWCDRIHGLHIYKAHPCTQLARTNSNERTLLNVCDVTTNPPNAHPLAHCLPLRVSALWEICLLEEDITSRRQPARLAPLAKPSYRGYSSGKLKTTLAGVQSIMEIQKPSSTCEWVMRRSRGGVLLYLQTV